MFKHKSSLSKRQVSNCYSAYLADCLFDFLRSLLVELDANLDRRLVETFLALVMVILMHRYRNQGLLLGELGGHLLDPDHAPAGTKREEESDVLEEAAQRWGSQVLHVWDRGFAGTPWLTLAYVHVVRFVVRWPKHYGLIDEQHRVRKAWEITRGKHSLGHRYLWDARRRCYRKVGIVFVPVYDRAHFQPLYLVVARPGQGREPWYLLTNERILTTEDAWQIVFAYARRWQVEMSLRYDKCELAFESPRLQTWERQFKLLLMVALAHAFLLSLLKPDPLLVVDWLLRIYCTGKANGARMS